MLYLQPIVALGASILSSTPIMLFTTNFNTENAVLVELLALLVLILLLSLMM